MLGKQKIYLFAFCFNVKINLVSRLAEAPIEERKLVNRRRQGQPLASARPWHETKKKEKW